MTNLAQLPDGAVLTPQQIMALQRQHWEQRRWNAHSALRLQSGHDTGLLAYVRVKKYETEPVPSRSRLKLMRSGR